MADFSRAVRRIWGPQTCTGATTRNTCTPTTTTTHHTGATIARLFTTFSFSLPLATLLIISPPLSLPSSTLLRQQKSQHLSPTGNLSLFVTFCRQSIQQFYNSGQRSRKKWPTSRRDKDAIVPGPQNASRTMKGQVLTFVLLSSTYANPLLDLNLEDKTENKIKNKFTSSSFDAKDQPELPSGWVSHLVLHQPLYLIRTFA